MRMIFVALMLCSTLMTMAAKTQPTVNLMPAILDAVRAHVTIGEITAALETVFGTWTERAVA